MFIRWYHLQSFKLILLFDNLTSKLHQQEYKSIFQSWTITFILFKTNLNFSICNNEQMLYISSWYIYLWTRTRELLIAQQNVISNYKSFVLIFHLFILNYLYDWIQCFKISEAFLYLESVHPSVRNSWYWSLSKAY